MVQMCLIVREASLWKKSETDKNKSIRVEVQAVSDLVKIMVEERIDLGDQYSLEKFEFEDKLNFKTFMGDLIKQGFSVISSKNINNGFF